MTPHLMHVLIEIVLTYNGLANHKAYITINMQTKIIFQTEDEIRSNLFPIKLQFKWLALEHLL